MGPLYATVVLLCFLGFLAVLAGWAWFCATFIKNEFLAIAVCLSPMLVAFWLLMAFGPAA